MKSGVCEKFIVSAAVLAAAYAAEATVLSKQELTLYGGWNAVYVEVSPTDTLDRVFADWPTDSVGIYDPGALLSTRQFSADGETEGLVSAPFATWRRGFPDLNSTEVIPAGAVLVYFGTNDAPVSVTVRGVPAAPRNRWHVSDGDDVYNYVGFSLQKGAKVSPSEYLDGFGGAYVANRSFFRLVGTDRNVQPELVKAGDKSKVGDGDVLVMHSDIVSDFSGPVKVSPVSGLDYGESDVMKTVEIRNDGTTARTVSVGFLDGVEDKALRIEYDWFYIRDADVARTNAAWVACTSGDIASKTLASGETWRLQIGLNRRASRLAEMPRGISFGTILRVTEDGASKMRVDVPLTAETSGGAAAARAWPAGLWVADVALNAVRAPGESNATETGGILKLRLPVHVDGEGKMRLLQRAVLAGTTAADGTLSYRIYAGGAAIPQTDTAVMRISAVCLPTEMPVVEATSGALADGNAVFDFIVDGGGSTSLLRHPLHPQHDGLRWDFKTPAPSGDDINNYKYDVKPETFSVTSHIVLKLDFNGGEASWNPTETVTGTCEWSLDGLRHEGAIVVSGPMTVKRIAPQAEIVVE